MSLYEQAICVNATEAAKAIRKELKEKFPQTKFSVRSQYYSMGSSVRIAWTDGIAQQKVEEIARKYEKIDRDEATGEILCGGNMFVHVSREISPDVRERVKAEIRCRYTFDENDYEFRSKCWEVERSTDYY